MDREAVYGAAPLSIAGFGVVLLVAAASHHVTEIARLGATGGPLLALALDGLPALGVIYGGYRIDRLDYRPAHSWRVFLATVAGSAVFGGVVLLSVLVRLDEGRVVGEPLFELLLACSTGGLAGFLAGYYSARSLEHAREATRARGTLSFTNSVLRHDITNDMTVIQGYANAIAEADPEDPLVADAAGTIDDRAEAVLKTIRTTGAISETFSADPSFEPVDLSAVVSKVVGHADDSLPATVTADLPESAPVLANEAVRPVVSNLVENGVEHNDASDPCVHVTVEPLDETVRLRVLDNGPGLPAEIRAALLEPRGTDSRQGGLHVVQTLVENYGGELSVADNDPRGTVFEVELPRA